MPGGGCSGPAGYFHHQKQKAGLSAKRHWLASGAVIHQVGALGDPAWPLCWVTLRLSPDLKYPEGNHTSFKRALLVYFLPGALFPSISAAEYFPTPLTSEAARETGEKEAPCYITTLCGDDLPLRLRCSPSVFFFSVCFPSLPALPAVSAPLSNSAGMRPLHSKYIQRNLITAITFLPGWLTVLSVPLNAGSAASIYSWAPYSSPAPAALWLQLYLSQSVSFSPLFSNWFTSEVSPICFSNSVRLFSWLPLFLVCPFNCCLFFHRSTRGLRMFWPCSSPHFSKLFLKYSFETFKRRF